MAGKVTFILKNPKPRTKETPVIMVFRYKSDQIRIYIGKKIRPRNWNPAQCRTREGLTYDDPGNLNAFLDTKEKEVMNAWDNYILEHETVSLTELTAIFKKIIVPEVKDDPKVMTLFKAIREFIDNAKKKKTKDPKTIISYEMTLNTLLKFNDTQKRDLTFEDINMDFYEDFIHYMTYSIQYTKKTNPEGEKDIKTGYSENTRGNRIKNLKTFMNDALEKGYTTNRGHLHKKFVRTEQTAETIYLNTSELETIYNLDLNDNLRLDRVRDLFIIGSFTGLRYSDLSQITPDKFIKEGQYLRIKTQKTGETVVIPLHRYIKEILQKYNGETPRPLSNQKMNDYLKELGKEAGIREKIIQTRTTAGLKHDQTFEKCDLITVHTARRSFATNAYMADIPAISIMKITGHRTEKAFLKYIKITQEQNAEKLSKHSFFTTGQLKVAL